MSGKEFKTTGNHSGDNKTPESTSQIGLEPEKKNFLDIKTLIRSIQRADGDTDCFRKGITDCDQVGCKWRHICLEDSMY